MKEQQWKEIWWPSRWIRLGMALAMVGMFIQSELRFPQEYRFDSWTYPFWIVGIFVFVLRLLHPVGCMKGVFEDMKNGVTDEEEDVPFN
jgi:hypothetical protein